MRRLFHGQRSRFHGGRPTDRGGSDGRGGSDTATTARLLVHVHVNRADRLSQFRFRPVLLAPERRARLVAEILHRVTVVECLAYLAGQQRLVPLPEPLVKYGVQQRVDGRVRGSQPLGDG